MACTCLLLGALTFHNDLLVESNQCNIVAIFGTIVVRMYHKLFDSEHLSRLRTIPFDFIAILVMVDVAVQLLVLGMLSQYYAMPEYER